MEEAERSYNGDSSLASRVASIANSDNGTEELIPAGSARNENKSRTPLVTEDFASRLGRFESGAEHAENAELPRNEARRSRRSDCSGRTSPPAPRGTGSSMARLIASVGVPSAPRGPPSDAEIVALPQAVRHAIGTAK